MHGGNTLITDALKQSFSDLGVRRRHCAARGYAERLRGQTRNPYRAPWARRAWSLGAADAEFTLHHQLPIEGCAKNRNTAS